MLLRPLYQPLNLRRGSQSRCADGQECTEARELAGPPWLGSGIREREKEKQACRAASPEPQCGFAQQQQGGWSGSSSTGQRQEVQGARPSLYAHLLCALSTQWGTVARPGVRVSGRRCPLVPCLALVTPRLEPQPASRMAHSGQGRHLLRGQGVPALPPAAFEGPRPSRPWSTRCCPLPSRC